MTKIRKDWAPHIVCSMCMEELGQWPKSKKSMRYDVPMIWGEQKKKKKAMIAISAHTKSKGIARRQRKILPIRIFHQHCYLFLMVPMCQSHHLQHIWTMYNLIQAPKSALMMNEISAMKIRTMNLKCLVIVN